ncbi:pimeloyl-ACP methyl ester carboxylesterase [Arthrobacter sp. CAN_A6]|uniref:alpha/beta fold hydrolase n=1 Tax=Arthrobacter sp. CAN_A6 TaxID=2787721 RepID=UPI0018CB64B9
MEAVNDTDGVRISYEKTGEGPPIVLVHGSGLSRAIWRGLGYVRAFKDQYQVVSLDLRGHGRSDKPRNESSYGMGLVTGDVLAVMDAEGIKAAHYFGYSFGARVGFSLLANHAGRMLSFISAGGTYSSPAGQIGSLFFPGYDAALTTGGMQEFVTRWGDADGHDIDPQTAAAFLANDALALRAYFRSSEAEQGLPESLLATLTTRSLLLAGSEDRLRCEDSQRAASLMPEAQFHLLPGRDHGRTLHPPGPLLELIRPFLESGGSSGP